MPVAIGALIGGLVGGSLAVGLGFATFATGWAIGSLIGQFLFAPTTSQVFTGPRLENTSPAVSNIVGNPIQIPYGTVRVPGAVIWSNNISEKVIKETVKQDGASGGGSSSTTVTYEYYLDFAVAICAGPISGLRRIWVNNKIIYDIAGDVVAEPWLKFNLYLGTETQTPDPKMQSILGAGNVPAYRGLAYIVFKQFSLKEYGNRAPYNIEFEIVANGNPFGSSEILEALPYVSSYGDGARSGIVEYTIDDNSYVAIGTADTRECFAVQVNKAAPKAGINKFITSSEIMAHEDDWYLATRSSHHLVGINKDNKLVAWHFQTTDQYDGDGETWLSLHELNGDFILQRNFGTHHSGSFIWYNSVGFILNRYWVEYESEATWNYFKFCDMTSDAFLNNDYKNQIEVSSTTQGITGYPAGYSIIWNKDGGTFFLGPGLYTSDKKMSRCFFSVTKDNPATDNRTSWYLCGFDETSFYGDAKLQVTPDALLDLTDYPAENLNPPCGDLTKKYNLLSYFGGILSAYDDGSGWWIFLTGYIDPTSTENPSEWRLIAAYKPYGQLTPTEWYQSNNRTYSHTSVGTLVNFDVVNYVPDNNACYLLDNNSSVHEFNFSTHEWNIHSYSPVTSIESGYTKLANIGQNRFIVAGWNPHSVPDTTQVAYIDLDKINSTSTTLGTIVSDISSRAGMDVSGYSTTEIDAIPVQGYTIRDRETARKSIEDVIYPFFVDPVVSDWILKFKKRGSTDFNLIPYNDLGCTDSNYVEPYSIAFPEEAELPKEIDFRYLSPSNNYQTAHQRAARHSKATASEDKGLISTEVVMTDNQAKETAIKFLSNAWINSKRLSIKLPKKYAYLEPTDIIQLYTKQNLLVVARIVEIFNNYNILEINAELEYYDIYDSVALTEFTAGFDTSDSQKIPIIAAMIVLPIESYPLYDILPNDSTADNTFAKIYLGATSYYSAWPGGNVHFSQDNTNFEVGDSLYTRMAVGIISSTSKSLADIEDYHFIDKETTITADFSVIPSNVSVTKEEILKGGVNLLWVENSGKGELILAQTVSNSGSSYTFSNLLRGRYGSHVEISKHTITHSALRVAVITANTLKSSNLPYGIFDVTYYYKGVTSGANPLLVASDSTLYTAKWNDTIPTSHITTSVIGSDIIINWIPVSNYPASSPFHKMEADPSCRLEILNISNTVLRTIDNITTNTYTYTAANMATDSVTLDSLLKFRVYRKSNMKVYDVAYGEQLYASSINNVLNGATATPPELIYLFNTQPTFTDLVGTSSSNLTLETGSGLGNKQKGLSRFTRRSGSHLFTKGNRWSTTSTTAGSDGSNYSFMIVFKTLYASSGTSTIEFFTRTSGGVYGPRTYKIYVNHGTKTVTFYGDLTNLSIGSVGDTCMIIVTADNETLAHTENIYLNGSKIATTSSGSFLGSWANEFLFGDTALTTGMASWHKIHIDMFAYWNYKLSAADIASLTTFYNTNGGFK